MGLARYTIIGRPGDWTIEHDGKTPHSHATKELGFRSGSGRRFACNARGP